MQSLDERDIPFTEEELKLPEFIDVLDNLQGHILHSYGRDRSVHIFLQFLDREKAKQWIARIASDGIDFGKQKLRITSAQTQLIEARAYDRGKGIRGRIFCCFFLSAHGYEALGISDLPTDEAFKQGMGGRRQLTKNMHTLNDPPKWQWDEGYREGIDAMLLLADRDEQNLPRPQQFHTLEVKLGLYEVAKICAIEYGRVRRNTRNQSIEHFGYVNGRSQPLFFTKNIQEEEKDRDGTDRWDPEAGPSLVLVKDPNGDPYKKGMHAYGSYLVFRKLKQDVDGFQGGLKNLSDTLHLNGDDQQRAEALVMGRFRDGTPLVLQSTPRIDDPMPSNFIPNNFTFIKDPQGLKCPFQAHIRKMNPRGERDRVVQSALAATLKRLSVEAQGEYDGIQSALATEYNERCHRISRRSVLYGIHKEEEKDNPSLTSTPEVGVLFMCYQKDIRRQFEFLQANWANNENAPAQGAGPDAIVGRVGTSQKAIDQKWPRQWNGMRCDHLNFNFPSFVTLKGGEYFFAPSISFLSNITAFTSATMSGKEV